MKQLFFIFIITFSLQSCAQKISEFVNAKTEYAAQNTETKTISLSNFHAIHSSAAIRVTVKKANERKIIIKSNAMQHVRAEVKNGELNIYYNNQNQSLNNVYTEAEVFTPDFRALDASSASHITVEDGFSFQNLNISVSSAAKVSGIFKAKGINIETSSASNFQGNIFCEKLNVEASSSSTSEIYGEAKQVNAEASSTAKVNIQKLKYTSLKKDVSSLGRIIE